MAAVVSDYRHILLFTPFGLKEISDSSKELSLPLYFPTCPRGLIPQDLITL
jgi:hypothetical protein